MIVRHTFELKYKIQTASIDGFYSFSILETVLRCLKEQRKLFGKVQPTKLLNVTLIQRRALCLVTRENT